MPFKERSFPPDWHTMDDTENWSVEALHGLRKLCRMLDIELHVEDDIPKDSEQLLNELMKHFGLPYRDLMSCWVHHVKNHNHYDEYLSEAKKNNYILLKAERWETITEPSCLTTLFRLWSPAESMGKIGVRIGLKGCSCMCRFLQGQRMNDYCEHIIYVLRFILNCPKELPFRDAFTRPEYDSIFAHSYPAQALRNAKSPNEDWRKVLDRIPHEAEVIIYATKEDELLVCVNCFQPINGGNCAQPCLGCGNLIHQDCYKKNTPTLDFLRLRHPKPDAKKCAVCQEKQRWEKWTESQGPPLTGDYEPSEEEEMKDESLKPKLMRIKYLKNGKCYKFEAKEESST
ncbi:hypothetical protein GE21DRAFT_6536 [Neurospora crassa]|uniref:SWIM-type domain-containing protein n=1 Tax=Neurospora crassa (strain ATCC 24698 / 74-OR23-1A / CBS 708.71 / DSM 1257 / FGSC 987) TaxID=367110 RepID=Q7S993_NEUCR|nr:hypothetical protein NCU07043 [Neurospora crassa OR74A]EAA32946.3 hypothetical protein NCU07043 [Neurospora crassa OR74A]KHE80961.1 hypothetical protein GE21DRAFT_6536 [Neurospora crassa]|eukprot:XP_962182.3 hypothetical protein NCU07043 [Neurospora crassa OR74A]